MYNTELFVVSLFLFRFNNNNNDDDDGSDDDDDNDDRTEQAQRKRVWNMSVRVFVQKWISAKTTAAQSQWRKSLQYVSIQPAGRPAKFTNFEAYLWLGYTYKCAILRILAMKNRIAEPFPMWTTSNESSDFLFQLPILFVREKKRRWIGWKTNGLNIQYGEYLN